MAKRTAESQPMKLIRKVATQLPETDAAPVCVKAAFQAGKKSFLFLGMKDDHYDVMIKLTDSLGEVEKLAKKDPDAYNVGLHGWVKLVFPHTQDPPTALLDKWILESYRNIVPKKISNQLDSAPVKKKATKKATKKKATTKKAAPKKVPKQKTGGAKAAKKTTRKKATKKKTTKKKTR